MRPVTGSLDKVSRPMTAVRGAGYTSQRAEAVTTPRTMMGSMPMSERFEER